MSIDNTYLKLVGDLKERIRQSQQRAALAVNTEMLELYWYIGNVISSQIKNAGWGAKIIDRLSADLKNEFPDVRGFSVRNLKYMRAFADAYPEFVQGGIAQLGDSILQPSAAKSQHAEKQNNEFVQPLVAQIPWSHHTVILDRIKSASIRSYYIQQPVPLAGRQR